MREAAKKELEEHDQATQRCIINISSTSGTHGNAGQANYSTVSLCITRPRAFHMEFYCARIKRNN